jgi:hypothetical protein
LTLVVLVILAALWAVVLLPPLLRSRSVRSNDSIGDFNYRLDVLGRTNGALHPRGTTRTGVGRASAPSHAAKRRRDVVTGLLVAVGVSGLLAIATNAAIAWFAFVVATLAFAAFCALWAWARSMQADRALKVRPMPQRAPEYRLRRAASS